MEYHLEDHTKEKITVHYEDTINPEIFPWSLFQGLTKYSPYDVFTYYSSQLANTKEAYYKNILKISGKSLQANIPAPIKYCYCQSSNEDDMIGSIK